MENRRQSDNAPAKSYNRGKYYPKSEGKSFGYNKYQSRDGNFAKRDNRSSGRDENRSQNRDDRKPYGRDDNRVQARNDRKTYSRDDNRFQGGRDEKFQSRNDRFRKTPGKFPPKSNDRFQNRKKFVPKDKPKPWFKDKLPKLVSDMQVSEGKHRGKFMQSTDSPKVRPTARRIREILFKVLFRRIRAKRFLDLCAGSGTVGIEAMSRGALLGTFVERSAKMCSFIKKNMETCGIKDGHGEVVQMEVVPFLKQMKKRGRCWDVVYFDPPYDSNYDEVLAYLSRGTAIEKGGILIIEHHAEMFFPEKIGSLKRWRVVVQDETALSFFERK